jgi:ribosomal protein L24
MEAPIHISNVMLLDSNQTPTRVGRRLEEGKLVRFAKSTGLTVQTREVEIQETDNN